MQADWYPHEEREQKHWDGHPRRMSWRWRLRASDAPQIKHGRLAVSHQSKGWSIGSFSHTLSRSQPCDARVSDLPPPEPWDYNLATWCVVLCCCSLRNLMYLKKNPVVMPARWLGRERHLSPRLMSQGQALGSAWWKERTNSHGFSPDLHTCAHSISLPYHTQKK